MSHRFLFLKHGLVTENAPGLNGLGRFVPQLARVTLKFCKESPSSSGVRNFIETDIVEFARHHPHVAVYLKPRRNRSPVLVAEYLNGEKDWCPLRDLTSEDVRGWLDLATTASGREFQHQSKHHHTLYPSVQGMWNSYVNTDPTVTQKQFPSDDLSRGRHWSKTASERLQEIFEKQQRQRRSQGDVSHTSSPGLSADEEAKLSSTKQSEGQ